MTRRTEHSFVTTPGRILLVLLALAALSTPASAQWTRVPGVPPTALVFSVWANGDTLLAGADSTVFISTDAGATWKGSARVAVGTTEVRSVLMRNGRLYAATRGQGVFVSDDFGDTWAGFNQGLGGLGVLDIAEMILHEDDLYLATIGAGAWIRSVDSGAWTLFGSSTLQTFQATNMDAMAAGGSRLFATGGFNGTVFYRDPGQSDWTLSLLFNDRFAPGLAAVAAAWTGRGWVVAGGNGVYRSATGAEPWTFVDIGVPLTFIASFATFGTDLYGSFEGGGGTLIAVTHDDGATWQGLDTLAATFVLDLARQGSTLYAGRADGLWRRHIDSVASVPDPPAPSRLAFAIAGPQPSGDPVRFTFELPAPGPIAIDVFDIAGRRVGDSIRETRAAGHGEVGWDAARLAPGVYHARLVAPGGHATARLVRTR